MSDHDAVAALPAAGDADHVLIRNVLVKRMPYALADADNPQTLVETDPASGAVILDILYLGRTFHYDPADATTPHDGVSCLVTSGGKRYKLVAGFDPTAYSVLSREDADPASPAIGDAYLVNVAATGDFAGEDNTVAVYTARGFEFIDFAIGRLVYVEDEDVFYRRKSDGSWSAGLGNSSLGAGTVAPSALIGGGGRVLWEIENQTTNVPPAVTNGTAYIIGSAPTAAWAGSAGKIAHGENAAWAIYTPAAGWTAYDKSAAQNYQYSGSAWLSATGRLNRTLRFYTASATWTKPARLAYAVITVVGGGGLTNSGGAGSTSSFGAFCSATGGAQTASTAGGAGGSGSGGDYNLTGGTGNTTITEDVSGGTGAGPLQPKGSGGKGSGGASTGGGGGGGCAVRVIDAATLTATVAVTVGTAGNNNGCVLVEEYTYA